MGVRHAISRENFLSEEYLKSHYVLMATRRGMLKKTTLWAFRYPWQAGIKAIVVREDDAVLEARLTDGKRQIVLASSAGRANRRSEERIRAMGRVAMGVIGIRLGEGESVIGMVVISEDTDRTLLTISANGYGKRTKISKYPLHLNAGKGVVTHRINEKTGALVALHGVTDTDDLMIITQNGKLIRQSVNKISQIARYAIGVRTIRLEEDDAIADVTRVVEEEEESTE